MRADDPLHYLRESATLYLNTVEGVTWATDSYWAVEVPDDKHFLARTLYAYNLDLKPKTMQVGETLTIDRSDTTPKDIEGLVLRRVPSDLERVEQHRVNGQPVYVLDDSYDKWLTMFDLPGGGVSVVNKKLCELVERMAPGEWYGSSDPMKMLVRKRDDGHLTGVLMPVRHLVSGTLAQP